MATASLEERLWAKVDKTDGCWLWRGSLTHGYGTLGGVRVHRLAYELLVGPIPEGLVLDHLCRVRNCVNPDHLEPVTERENILRGIGPTALNAQKTHCDNGHEFTPENTVIYTHRGGIERTCRACKLLTDRVARRTYRARRPPSQHMRDVLEVLNDGRPRTPHQISLELWGPRPGRGFGPHKASHSLASLERKGFVKRDGNLWRLAALSDSGPSKESE